MKGILHIAGSTLALIVAGTGLAHAQAVPGASMAYGNVDAADDTAAATDGDGADPARKAYSPPGSGAGAGGKPRKRTRIVPYLEVDQSVYDQTEPRTPLVTYTTVAAGADVTIANRRTSGVATIRYEHHFVEKGDLGNSDTVTGLVRTTTDIVPHTLAFDFGGLATRTSVGPTGGALLNPVDNVGSIYQVWSVYGGPSLSTHAGIVGLKAGADLGYNEIDQLHTYVPASGGPKVDLFGHSLTGQANASAGVKPGEVLPFGVTLSAGYMREDISDLDQRLIDKHAGVQVMQPVSRTTALVGDIGWEKLTVSSRDALRDGLGNPLIAPNGQYVIDTTAPRKLAYRTDGLTWDVGVMCRPMNAAAAVRRLGRHITPTSQVNPSVR